MTGEFGIGKFDAGKIGTGMLEFCEYPYSVDDSALVDYYVGGCIDDNAKRMRDSDPSNFMRSHGRLFSSREIDPLIHLSTSPSDRSVGAEILKKRLETERQFCQEVQEQILSFVREAAPKMFDFYGQSPRTLKFSVVPEIIRYFDTQIRHEPMREHNGVYLSDMDMAIVVTNSLRTEKFRGEFEYDYKRLAIHELTHAISLVVDGAGFTRMTEEDGKRKINNIWAGLGEGMTEFLTREFFKKNYPAYEASFNSSYLKAERLILALADIMGGIEQFQAVYFSGQGVETLLQTLNSRSGLVFDEDFFDRLINNFLPILSTKQWKMLLTGKKVKIFTSMDLPNEEREELLKFFPNLKLA